MPNSRSMYRASRRPDTSTTRFTDAAAAFLKFPAVSLPPQRDRTLQPLSPSHFSVSRIMSSLQFTLWQPSRLTVPGRVSRFSGRIFPMASRAMLMPYRKSFCPSRSTMAAGT